MLHSLHLNKFVVVLVAMQIDILLDISKSHDCVHSIYILLLYTCGVQYLNL